jgi:lipopolysaccharide/colanic/teichoic acid biosynthesis glycosyltransferase
LFVALALLLLNPWLSPGSLFFVQERMGRNCQTIRAWKFRSMIADKSIDRGAFDVLDVHRITPIGRLLRRSRLDELPQILNVLRGEMSLIGPRPHFLQHALVYLDAVPGYRERYSVPPGISGFAQTELGYASSLDSIRAQVRADLYYVRRASFSFDTWIAWRTLVVVVKCRGI